jgi:hypothetical protein
VIILDTLLVGGLRFVLGKIVAAVEAEMEDDSALREELLAAQMRLELGELSEAEYATIERDLLAAINEVRSRTRGETPAPGTFKVTGIEAEFTGDRFADEEEDQAERRRGR